MLGKVVDIVREAGALALSQRGDCACRTKADGTWVTEADRATEEFIRHQLHQAFPSQPVFGEEMAGDVDLSRGPCWLVDPIDGTGNYVVGIPVWGVSVGLVSEGFPVLGVFYMPSTGDLFAAARGEGAWLNGQRLSPLGETELEHNSLIALNSEAMAVLEFTGPGKVRNLGSGAAHACYVVSGALSAAVFEGWRTWDLAAALCMAQEVGAVAEDLCGGRLEGLARIEPDAVGGPLIIGQAAAVAQVRSCLRWRDLKG